MDIKARTLFAAYNTFSDSTDRGVLQWPRLQAQVAPRIAVGLYAAELAGLKARRARRKARGEDTADLDARIEMVGKRGDFYDAVVKGYYDASDAMPIRGWDTESEGETIAPATAVMPKLSGPINQVGQQLAPLKPKAIKLDGNEGRTFSVVKQVPEAGAPLPANGHYELTLQAPTAWTKNHVVLLSMIYRLAPEWLSVADYASLSDKVAGIIQKTITGEEIRLLKTHADEQIEHWVSEIVKQAGSGVKPGPLAAALKFAVTYVK